MNESALAGVWPLSPLQEGMLFHALFDERDTDVYVEQITIGLEGKVDADVLRKSWQALLDRHESLRAGFRRRNSGTPIQLVMRRAVLPWHEEDVSGLPEDEALAEADRLGIAARAQRFDLAVPPLLRILLVKLAPDRYQMVFTLHHILLDGWSLPILMQELWTAYEADGSTAGLPEVTPYRNYLEWLGRQDKEAAREAWRRGLDGVEGPTLVAPAVRDAAPAHCDVVPGEASVELSEALEQLTRAQGVTLNTVVQAAWALVVGKLTGRRDVVFGAAVAGRPADLPGMERMLGLFINTVPVRVRFDPAQSVADLLTELQGQQSALMDYQYLGLSDIQRLAGPGATFDTLMAFENFPSGANAQEPPPDEDGELPQPGGLKIVDAGVRESTNYPLGLVVSPMGGLGARLSYRPDVFGEGAARAVLDQLFRVLEGMAADPQGRVGRLDVLGAAERVEVVESWNATAREVASGTLGELFAAQVERSPDAVAVVGADVKWSYAELADRSDRVACELIARGVGRGDLVGVVMERSADLVGVLLGVVKAGAAFVPVDPAYPRERIAFMLGDSAPALVVCTAATQEVLPAGAARWVYGVEEAPRSGRIAPPVAGRPEDAAYVIYTSGSTGTPKGVVVTHSGIGNLAASQVERFGVEPGSRVLQLASLSFDAAVSELCMALLSGASLVMAGADRLPPHGSLTEVASAFEVTHVTVPPSVLATVEELPAAVRTLVVAGEACSPGLVERWSSGRRLVNAYGPTEVTVCATMSQPLSPTDEGPVPIGQPIGNTQAYVLDDFLQPAAIGVTGELYVSGPGLARGYLGKPTLTAERFIASPFPTGDEAAERMYRTGDLAHWTPDGNLVFAGRADEQVKIRGFRIEPGEIESLLTAHESVAQAAVIIREDRPGDKRLIAYVTPAHDQQTDVSALREHARDRLPDYMIPTAIVPLESLPITVNGKLDRAALPAPDFAAVTGGTGSRGPATPLEEVLCGLFAEVLGLEQVGAEASFFDLGGDSLLAMRLIARIRAVLDTELAISDLFAAPTVAEAARLIDADDGTGRAALTRRPRPDVLPLSYAQQRMWFLNRLEENDPEAGAAYNMPMALRLSGELDTAALEAALGDVADRHESLRTIFPETEGTPRQQVLEGAVGRPPLVVADTPAEQVDAVIAAQTSRGFDLSVDLPWRIRLLATGPAEHVLLIVAHHVAVDGWSMGVLARDLGAAYTARREGRAPEWQPLPVQYADYALWQREVLGELDDPGSLISGQLAYWHDALAGAPQELPLPADRQRPPVASFQGNTVPVRVDAQTHERLVGLAQRSKVTTFMVLQAALAALLSRMGAGDDIPIGTAVAGRGDAALDDLAGFFVNTLVLRTDLSSDPPFTELLGRVREADLSAYAHQDLPFERVVEDLNPTRSMGRNPLFQVSLGVQSASQDQGRLWDLPGLRVRPLAPDSGPESVPARVDLSAELSEQRDGDGRPAGIGGVLLYATDLFDEGTAEALAARFVRLLEQVVSDPAVRLSAIDVLGEGERALLVEGWNGVAPQVPVRSLGELFAAQVGRSPDAVAVVGAEAAWSYAELDAVAARVAAELAERGVGRGDLVGVVMERSPDLIGVLLGVVKAGAAFVPVDPSYPRERIAFILADSAPALVVCTAATHELVPAGAARLRYDDPQVAEAMAARPPEFPAVTGRPEDPAYVIYTSGSTGTPKGVVVSHSGIANLAATQQHDLGAGAGARVLQLASLSFDAAVWELCMALLSGAALVVPGVDRLPPHGSLAEAAAEFGVTHLTVSPSVLATVEDLPAGLRTLVVAAETCPPALVERWSDRRVINAYGPTETTVCATMTGPLADVGDGPVPIGRPFGGTQVYVLDEFLKPAAAGVTGELYVAGPGLARGYLGRPALTAERFVASPFASSGGRMYRTGDRGRWTGAGQLQFAGRTDDQVKIRGFRVEPGEIEAVLGAYEAVAQVTVIAREDRPGARRLVAYVVPDAGREVEVPALREFAAGRLPDYMVPTSVVVLPALPVTANGKLDRAALPAPDAADLGGREPRTPTEEVLCGLFGEVLGLERVSAEVSFFDLGGDSLLAMRLIARIREALQAEVSIRALFTAPTVEAVARSLSGGDGAADLGLLLPLRTEGDAAPVFCVHPSTGLSWCYSALVDRLPQDRPVYGLQARGYGAGEQLPESVVEMAADYVEQIRTVQPAGPYHLLGWSFGGAVAQAMATRLQELGEEVALLVSLDGYPAGADGPAGGAVGERRPTARILSEIQRVNANNLRLLRDFRPAVFRGDLLLFVAAEGGRPDSVTPAVAAGSWDSYVDGAVEGVLINSDHDGMMKPKPLAEIAGLISEKLA
ncbi:amino acid adenylation domain-containing protein [Streptomyces sp. A7024]|uniref:Amino acid adenylation domain-containing protein n=1 Tax=Streptomyces coryli TaxID=1128680 RepID=A0A6G4U4W7_9ACTN|nr:non-ribosomal peptide synthetase [Streptomyces coryli]NGN66780.1 amino acid adenylation domain-containing protein [Streptomyces coryli]